jgi:hypothetical protein
MTILILLAAAARTWIVAADAVALMADWFDLLARLAAVGGRLQIGSGRGRRRTFVDGRADGPD